MKKANVLIGIGGWEHEAFDDCFYSRSKLSSKEKLRFYSRHFDTVEVRSTFWDDEIPASEAVEWVDAVKENRRFKFTVKLHASFTHKISITPTRTKQVRRLLHELAKSDRLGTLLIQFPYSFTNTSANRYHVIRLGELFRGFPACVEFRHESWNNAGMIGFLSEQNFTTVYVDLPRIKHFMPLLAKPTGGTLYMRLHGRNEKGWLLNGMDSRYDYLYNMREVRELLKRLEVLAANCSDVTVIFNNTTAGKSIVNALQFSSAMRERGEVLVPRQTLRQFPVLNEIARATPTEEFLFASDAYREAI